MNILALISLSLLILPGAAWSLGPEWQHIRSAESFMEQGLYPEAKAEIKKAFKLNPDEPKIWENAAMIYKETGPLDKAVQNLKKAISISERKALRFAEGTRSRGKWESYIASLREKLAQLSAETPKESLRKEEPPQPAPEQPESQSRLDPNLLQRTEIELPERLQITQAKSVRTSHSASSNKTSGKLALGVGWPYLSVKYGLSKTLSIEGRGAFGSGIKAWGGRGYFNFNPGSKTILYAGVEADYISFDTEGVKGNGTLYMPFIGGEYFLSEKSSVTLDFGPALIDLKDSEKIAGEQTSVNGCEWIVNFGLYFHFGGIM